MLKKLEDVKPVSEPSPEPIAEPVNPDVKPEEKVPVTEEVAPKPAAQEPGPVPYKRFQEVNDKARLLEEELKIARESSVSPEKLAELPDWELMTETEKYLAKELMNLKEKQKWEEDFTRAKKTFPELGDKAAEFKDFAYKYPKSVDVEVLAKSFLFKPTSEPVEKPALKGLEKPTGGSRQVPAPGLTLDEIKRLRENQPKLYEKMVIEGKLPKKLPEK